MNNVVISGRVAQEPTNARTKTGKLVARATLAVNGKKDLNGLAKTMWLDVTFFGFTAEYVLKYFHKGDYVAVEGRLDHESYKRKDGSEAGKFLIIAQSAESLRRSERNNVPSNDDLPIGNETISVPHVSPQAKELEIDDDDMPF